MTVTSIRADYHNEQHTKDLLMLLNAYALDPMGGGKALSDFTQKNLITTLQQRSEMLTILCYVDDEPAGIVNCVEGFSTFNCKPLLNIHDCGVLTEYRGMGLTRKMFTEVEKIAREKGCCKLTLEVLEGNTIAKHAYKNLGFTSYELDPEIGQAMFWEKKLK